MLRFTCILMAVALTAPPLSAQDVLTWKFQTGETLKFNVQQTMKTQMAAAGNTVDTSMSQIMDMSWKVDQLQPGGSAIVGQQIDRVRIKMEGGPFGSGAEFDSNDNRVPSNAMVKSMSDVFRKIVGQPFKVTMNPTGQVANVDVPPSLLKSLTDNGAGVSNVLSEDMLKQMMGQSSVTLPEGAVSNGSTWQTKQNVQLPFGTISVTSQMTYQGIDSQTGYAKIAMQPSVAVEPNKDSPIQLQLTGSDGEGMILFDQQNGRIARSDLTLNLQMQLKQFGQTMTQNIEQRTVMQLVP